LGVGMPDPSVSNGTRWDAVEVYFGMCCFLTIVGAVAFVLGINSPAVNRRLAKRDQSLRFKKDTIYEGDADNAGREAASLIKGETDTDAAAALSTPTSVSVSGGGGEEHLRLDSVYEQSLSTMEVAKMIWQNLVAQFLVTAGGQMVVSQYVNIPNRHFDSQTTALVYEYYCASAAGMFLALWKWSHFGPRGMLIAVTVRLLVYPLILLYIVHPNALAASLGDQGADYFVSAVNILFCFSNGHLFSNTYSDAQKRFKTPAGASRGASTISVMYYVAISFAIGATLVINTFMCGGDDTTCLTRGMHHHGGSGLPVNGTTDPTMGGVGGGSRSSWHFAPPQYFFN